jgi:hypothetical protein
MREPDLDSFETELRGLRPAKLPDDFAMQLAKARPECHATSASRITCAAPRSWRSLIRWLAPVAVGAACLIALVFSPWLRGGGSRESAQQSAEPSADSPAFRADDVEIGRDLVGAFDAVATLPDGEPVRLRCREWMDEVVLRDTTRGVAIEQRMPRLEIVPVRFETF